MDIEYKRCCIWTFFPAFQMFVFFQCLQARLESLLAHKRENFMFYMASPDHTFRKKQGQFFWSSVFTNSLELQILNNFIRISKTDNLCTSAAADPIYPSSITGLEISCFFNRLLQCSKNTADDAKIAEKLLKNT